MAAPCERCGNDTEHGLYVVGDSPFLLAILRDLVGLEENKALDRATSFFANRNHRDRKARNLIRLCPTCAEAADIRGLLQPVEGVIETDTPVDALIQPEPDYIQRFPR